VADQHFVTTYGDMWIASRPRWKPPQGGSRSRGNRIARDEPERGPATFFPAWQAEKFDKTTAGGEGAAPDRAMAKGVPITVYPAGSAYFHIWPKP